MKSSIYTKLVLASSMALILSACGGSSSKTPNVKEQAIDNIEAYAQNGGTAPTVQDYTNAGVTGVTTANIANINEIVENLTAPEVDTTEEIQNLINTTVTPVIISHNGVNYSIVVSPISGRTWLDRNIGAKQICTSPYDVACYGDYYQWGRNIDGHEKPQSKTTTQKGKTITDSGNKFVTNSSGDWTSSKNRGANWRATDGRSVCPVGFRVPSREEFQTEVINIENKKDQFENFLKLPYAGYRDQYNGNMREVSESLYYWLNAPVEDVYAYSMQSSGDAIYLGKYYSRTNGMAIRCIKN